MIALHYIENNAPFPSVDTALDEPNGLLAFGADLSPSRLFSAYSQGIFPWFSDDEPLLWWSPNPRAIIELDDFVASKSLLKLARKRRYHVTLNYSFDKVIAACSSIPRKTPNNDGVSNETWITEEMVKAYCHLHGLGIAHSVEVWDDETLVGGLYGLQIGSIFCGESMFSRQTNASKVALVHLCARLWKAGFDILDSQFVNEHLKQFGCYDIPNAEYQLLLSGALGKHPDFSLSDCNLAAHELVENYLRDRS